MTVPVKWFSSAMSGAPTQSGTAGDTITVLNALLLNGFNSKTLTSVTRSGSTATATLTSHGFTDLCIVLIAGATQTEYNGEFRISVVDANTFTFTVTGTPTTPATGTITCKVAPLGWTSPYTGTNKAVYRSSDASGTQLYFRIADDGTGSAAYARVRGYETMSAVDTGTGPFPTDAQVSGGGYFHKSNGANSTTRAWKAFGDSRCFYLFSNADGSTIWGDLFFGDPVLIKAGDAYGCMICSAGTTSTNASRVGYMTATTVSVAIARAQSQTGTSINPIRYSHARCNTVAGNVGATYPNPSDNTLMMAPMDIWDDNTTLRSIMPGLYVPLHAYSGLTQGQVVTNTDLLPGRTLHVQMISVVGTLGAVVIDITGNSSTGWR